MAKYDLINIVYFGRNIPTEILNSKKFCSMSLEAQTLYCKAWSYAIDLAGKVNKAKKRGKASQDDYESLAGCFVYTPEYLAEYVKVDPKDLASMNNIYHELSQNKYFIWERNFDMSRLDDFGIEYKEAEEGSKKEGSKLVRIRAFYENHLNTKKKTATKEQPASETTAPSIKQATSEKEYDPFNGDEEVKEEKAGSPPPAYIQEQWNDIFTKAGKAPLRFDKNGCTTNNTSTTQEMKHIYELSPGTEINDYILKCINTHPAYIENMFGAKEIYRDLQANKGKPLTGVQHQQIVDMTDKYREHRKTHPLKTH